MMTTDLGACEWFVWDLRRSNLIDRGQLDQVIGEYLQKNPGAEPPALAEYLIGQGILTDFQAERLLQGKTQGFVLGPFTLMDSLGTGSMGTVYKARSKTDNDWYAVKVLPRRSMWRRFASLAARCRLRFEAVPPPVRGSVCRCRHGWRHALPGLADGRGRDARQNRREAGQAQAGTSGAVRVASSRGTGAVSPPEPLPRPAQALQTLMIAPDGAVRILDFGIGCLLAETEGESLVDTMSTANSVNSGLDFASPESIMDPTDT